MGAATLRVLIWGKTYPEISRRYVETVCTAGVLEDGCPVRLYPVPLRYLQDENQYKLYDIIEVSASKNASDPRPESYKIKGDTIIKVGHIDTDRYGWKQRGAWILKDSSWQFASVEQMKRLQKENGRSLGIVTPGKIEGVHIKRKPATEGAEYRRKLAEARAQSDMFLPEYKDLAFPPCEVKLRWRCSEACKECSGKPHDMNVLDWGLIELGRREGWEAAKTRLEDLSMSGNYDLKLFMGNFRQRLWVFGIVGLWYPKHHAQAALPI
jgi:hypothetical protein